jgi:hypothetical protein
MEKPLKMCSPAPSGQLPGGRSAHQQTWKFDIYEGQDNRQCNHFCNGEVALCIL